jgi:hypothetical protein
MIVDLLFICIFIFQQYALLKIQKKCLIFSMKLVGTAYFFQKKKKSKFLFIYICPKVVGCAPKSYKCYCNTGT